VIATAGHCVQSPANEPHERIDHLVFLLNYNNERWDGRFPVRNIYTVNGWSQQGIDGFDFAFLSVAHNNYGSRPGDLVIQTPIRFAAPPTQGIFSLYGYPNAIDEGEHLVKCSEMRSILS
ncbi:MAG TPA: trypsin-like serine peptidase, partial [Xylella fastidiosa subsp. pauca]